MIVLRSVLFNTAFYLNLILRMIVLSPYYFLASHENAWSVPKNWVRSNHWLLEKIVGTRFTIEGLENIPDGGYILAPKHQSFWDAYALLPWVRDAVYILKRELMWIPLFGWYVGKMRMIPVNRGARGKVNGNVYYITVKYICETENGIRIDATQFIDTSNGRQNNKAHKFFSRRRIIVRLPSNPRIAAYQIKDARRPDFVLLKRSPRNKAWWNVIKEIWSDE